MHDNDDCDDDNDDINKADDFCMRPWDTLRTCHSWKENCQQFVCSNTVSAAVANVEVLFPLSSNPSCSLWLFFSFEDNLSSFSVSQHVLCVCRRGQCDRVETMTHPLCFGKSDVNQRKWFWSAWTSTTHTHIRSLHVYVPLLLWMDGWGKVSFLFSFFFLQIFNRQKYIK